jgi:signal recognition particle subunit SRP54
MGPLQQVMGMIPGMSRISANAELDEKALGRIEAIIRSMTKEERRKPHIINGFRRKRIAGGSGTSVQEVNRVLKQFGEMQKMMKSISRGRIPNMLRGLNLPA